MIDGYIKDQILSKTRSGQLLKKRLDYPLIKYLRELIPYENTSSDFSQTYRDHVSKNITDRMKNNNLASISEAKAEFEKSPVIQMGEHSGLLFNTDNFIFNWLFQIALREKNRSYAFSWQCSHVRSLTQKVNTIGPGYVSLNKNVYRVFDFIDSPLSKTKLHKTNIASLDNVVFVFEPQNDYLPVTSQYALSTLLTELKDTQFKNASEAFLFANQSIWEKITLEAKTKLIQFDDTVASDILIANLKDKDSIVHKILFNKDIREKYLLAKQKIINSKKNLVLKNTSDFFYIKRDMQLDPLKIQGNSFINARTGQSVALALDKENIIESLQQRNIYSDLIFSYLFVLTVPRVLALGGTSQQEYMASITEIILETNKFGKFIPDRDVNLMKNQRNYALIGPALVELTPKQQNVIAQMSKDTDFKELENTIVNKTLEENLGRFNAFSYLVRKFNLQEYQI